MAGEKIARGHIAGVEILKVNESSFFLGSRSHCKDLGFYSE